MARVFKILPDVDDDFHSILGLIMFIMAIIMVTSLFTYRSLVQAVIMIYTSYIILTYKNLVNKYIFGKLNSFRPVLAPHNNKPSINDSDDGYDEDDDVYDEDVKNKDKDIPIKKNDDELSNNPFDYTNEIINDESLRQRTNTL